MNINQIDFQISDVRVKRSVRRKNTCSARLNGRVMFVNVPIHTPEEKISEIVESFRKRFHRQNLSNYLNTSEALRERAEFLNRKFFNGKLQINSIRWTVRQAKRFGCCNFRKKSILLAHQVASMPAWVRDYVILHELAHLLEPNHGRQFWELVRCYDLAERARGFLIAKGMDDGNDD